ncbi:MAG: hypothetical protein WCG02_02060 [Candidatus Taylorbacteria bacterium]
MPHTKSTRSAVRPVVRPNKKVKQPAKPVSEDADELAALPVANIRKAPEIDIHDDVIGIIEEKPEVDPLLAEEDSEDGAGEEATLDEEEINPFGDKWEV